MQWNSELKATQREKWQLLFIVLFIYATILTDMVRLLASLTGSGVIRLLVEVVRNGLYIGVFAGFYLFASNKARIMGFASTLIYVLVLALSMLINPQLETHVVSLSLLFISRYLLGFVMLATLTKPIQLCKEIVKMAWVLPIYLLLYAITPHDMSSGSSYSMSLSYNLLIPALACLFSAYLLKEKKAFCYFIFLLSVFGILFYGSRGTVICIGLGLVYALLINKEKLSLRKLVFQIVVAICIFSIFMFKNEIVLYLLKLAPNSRTLKLLADESFFWTSNRDQYFDVAKEALKSEPLRIYGLAGDAYYYSMQARKTMELGRHSHNMFLELLLSYGLFVGLLLCLAWLILLICAVIKTKNNPNRKTVFLLFVIPLIPYILISGSTCQSHYHWLLLGALAYCAFSKNTSANAIDQKESQA